MDKSLQMKMAKRWVKRWVSGRTQSFDLDCADQDVSNMESVVSRWSAVETREWDRRRDQVDIETVRVNTYATVRTSYGEMGLQENQRSCASNDRNSESWGSGQDLTGEHGKNHHALILPKGMNRMLLHNAHRCERSQPFSRRF